MNIKNFIALITHKIKLTLSALTLRRNNTLKTEIITLAPNELLKGKCALITGGTSGIGFSIAKAFLNAGAFVIITGRSKNKIDDACKALNCENKVIGFVMDNANVSSFESIFANMLSTINSKGILSIDILVNNAGVIGGKLPNATEEEYDRVLSTNLKGVFFLSQLVGKYMKENKIRGNILNIASSSSLRPAVSAYTLSKWGIRGLTMGLARALAPYGITVNGIAPGQTATPMMKKEYNDLANYTCPLGRWILPEEIANGALFLVSGMGRAIVGDIIYMTGGSAILTYEDMNYSIF